MSQAEVVQAARAEAARIVDEANAKADRLRRECDAYVDTTLREFEETLGSALHTVSRSRASLWRGHGPAGERGAAAPGRSGTAWTSSTDRGAGSGHGHSRADGPTLEE